MKKLRKIINIKDIPCLLLKEDILKCSGFLCFRKFKIRKYLYKEEIICFIDQETWPQIGYYAY